MPQLIIAEKPSVAQSIAKVLGVTGRCNGYLENSAYIVSWCVGHLAELAPPSAYNETYAKWSLNNLPILPQKSDQGWQHQVLESTKKRTQQEKPQPESLKLKILQKKSKMRNKNRHSPGGHQTA